MGRSKQTVHRSNLAGCAEYGYCASHSRYFWGLRLHLLTTLHGLPIGFALAGAKADERQVLPGILDDSAGRRSQCTYQYRMACDTGERVVTRPGPSYSWLVYDHDPEEVEILGWEEFIACQWESIFIGYRSWVGRRSMVRRWSDLFEVGLGCPQEIAGSLARAEIMNRADRELEDAASVEALVSGMIGVVADLRDDLAELGELGSDLSGKILDQHTRLLSFVRAQASGQ